MIYNEGDEIKEVHIKPIKEIYQYRGVDYEILSLNKESIKKKKKEIRDKILQEDKRKGLINFLNSEHNIYYR